ncbi:MAG TPA: hypothetical protein VER96_19435 [Polyangiaceae bacterium]|nr:hypothetical protein [Polyangiaceae bacterium]
MRSHEEFGLLLKHRPEASDFSPRQQLIWNVGQLAIELEMGGLGQFLYNISPSASDPQSNVWSRLRDTIASLAQIGATATANRLAALLPLLEASASDDGTWEGFLDSRGIELDWDKELEEYDELFELIDLHFATAPE